MKAFFSSTYYLWIVTKVVMTIATFISVGSILSEGNLRLEEVLANLVAAIYALLLLVSIISSFQHKNLPWIRYTTGIISVIIGVALFVVVFYFSVHSVVLTLLFAVWIILLGLFDILQVERNNT